MKVILNPYSELTDQEKEAVYKNEALRLFMKQKDITPKFSLTEEQEQFFKGTPYEKDEINKRRTLVSRILTGDPSSGSATDEQLTEAKKVMQMYGE